MWNNYICGMSDVGNRRKITKNGQQLYYINPNIVKASQLLDGTEGHILSTHYATGNHIQHRGPTY